MKGRNPKGDMPHLAHELARQSVVYYILYLRICKKFSAGESGVNATADEKSWLLCQCQSQKVSSFINR